MLKAFLGLLLAMSCIFCLFLALGVLAVSTGTLSCPDAALLPSEKKTHILLLVLSLCFFLGAGAGGVGLICRMGRQQKAKRDKGMGR